MNLGKDIFFLLGVEMELPTLLKFCASSKDMEDKVCKDIWLSKLKKEFPDEKFLLDKSPKERYILLYSLRDVKEKLKRKETLEDLYNLKKLDLYNNQLTEIPASLGNLSNLQQLNLSNNKLTEIPNSLGNLYNLKLLVLSNNELTKIPDSLGNLTNLNVLRLSNNQLTEIPDSLGNLTNLLILNLNNNKIKKIPDTLENLSKLETLYLDNNDSIKIPNSLGSNLRYLYLSKNVEIPPSLKRLNKNLQIFI